MSEEELVDALKAVAHPVRLRILETLAGAELNVGEIDEMAKIGQPALSQQLAVLRGAGLVTTRKQAKLVFYRIDEERVASLALVLGGFANAPARTTPKPRRAAPGVANFARLG